MLVKIITDYLNQKNILAHVQSLISQGQSTQDLKSEINNEITSLLRQEFGDKIIITSSTDRKVISEKPHIVFSSIVGRNNLDIEFSMLGGNFSYFGDKEEEHLICNYFMNQIIAYTNNEIIINNNQIINQKPNYTQEKVVISQLLGFKVHERPEETAQMYNQLRVIQGVDRIAKSWCPSIDWIAFFKGKIHTIVLYRTDFAIMSAGVSIARKLGYKVELIEEKLEDKLLISGLISNQENSQITIETEKVLKKYARNLTH